MFGAYGFSFVITFLITNVMQESFLRLVVVCVISTLLISVIGYRFILPVSIREKIIEKIKNKIWKKEI